MSDSVRPHRWQPTRLPRPWDSPGKNAGVRSHFLLQCMKVKSESEVAQSYPTLHDPMDCSLPGSSIHGIFQARVLESGKRWEKVKSDLIKKTVLIPLGSLITCECLHFWHLVATGWGKPGKMFSSCWKINSCTSSMLCSKCVTPNGTVVWITREGPISDDSRRGTQRCILKWVIWKCLSASQSRFKNWSQ